MAGHTGLGNPPPVVTSSPSMLCTRASATPARLSQHHLRDSRADQALISLYTLCEGGGGSGALLLLCARGRHHQYITTDITIISLYHTTYSVLTGCARREAAQAPALCECCPALEGKAELHTSLGTTTWRSYISLSTLCL